VSSLGASGGAFIGARGGMVAWARAAGEGETRGKNGRSFLAGAGGARRGASSARGRGKSSREGFLRGVARDLVGPRKTSDTRASPLGQAALAAPGAPASWPAGDGTGAWGRREVGEDDGTYVHETKIAGV
jgi:hypothetical protein